MTISTKSYLCVTLFTFSTLRCLELSQGKKTSVRAGLAGIAQFSGSQGHAMRAMQSTAMSSPMFYYNSSRVNALKRLKHDLFDMQGYDKAIRPVENITEVVLVYIDLTYMQVLNLNEKEQTLRSLIRYRLYWKDHYLVWDPSEYDNITDIWLPATSLWSPDIVCYEDTGTRDYTPRIPYVVVQHDGTVRYLEPTAFETTCLVNILNFPFDQQVCTFTFTSWTFPTTKLDLMSRRTNSDIEKDISTYFAKNGEWQLYYINVSKESQSFMTVLSNDNELESKSESEKEIISAQYYSIEPNLTVREVTPLRISDLHWSEVKFTLKFKRSSSLYVQSMIFPAMLLTTISLLGFYLPPNSGERIGLIITILLTFMVFLLTVGDMFPASTGPYLGIYFVLCMVLLALNIIMTVLVLYLYHISCEMVLKTDTSTGIIQTSMQRVPSWIKLVLILTGFYAELHNFKITEDCYTINENTEKNKETSVESMKKMWKKLCTFGSKRRLKQNQIQPGNVGFNNSTTVPKTNSGIARDRVHFVDEPTAVTKRKKLGIGRITASTKETSKTSGNDVIKDKLEEVSNNMVDLNNFAAFRHNELKTEKVGNLVEEKWKAAARRIDVICMKAYILCLLAFHLGIVLAIYFRV